MLLAVTSAKSYSFSEFFSSSVTFFTVSAVITLMTWDHTAGRNLQFLMKWLLSLQCMHSHFVWHSVTFFSDTHCALCLSSVFVAVTMMCSVSSQFMLFVWDCCVMMIVVVWHSWVTAFWIEFKLWLTHCSKSNVLIIQHRNWDNNQSSHECYIKTVIKKSFLDSIISF